MRETAGLTGAELGTYRRRDGLHQATVSEWREQALATLGGNRARTTEQKRIRELERELTRKDQALAERAALLVPEPAE